jgi:hypothetical protein
VLRTVRATIGAMATALVNLLFRAGERATVELERGDRAPAFSLRGSDGRTHALADYAGRSAVVLAWFPKAFTGG